MLRTALDQCPYGMFRLAQRWQHKVWMVGPDRYFKTVEYLVDDLLAEGAYYPVGNRWRRRMSIAIFEHPLHLGSPGRCFRTVQCQFEQLFPAREEQCAVIKLNCQHVDR